MLSFIALILNIPIWQMTNSVVMIRYVFTDINFNPGADGGPGQLRTGDGSYEIPIMILGTTDSSDKR